jgi:hypothetical protein
VSRPPLFRHAEHRAGSDHLFAIIVSPVPHDMLSQAAPIAGGPALLIATTGMTGDTGRIFPFTGAVGLR